MAYEAEEAAGVRPLHEIAAEIAADWKKPYFGAVPYLEAMLRLDGVGDMFGEQDGETIVMYFLSNAGTWRGAAARRVKAELQGMLT